MSVPRRLVFSTVKMSISLALLSKRANENLHRKILLTTKTSSLMFDFAEQGYL